MNSTTTEQIELKPFTTPALRELAELNQGPCASLLMPTAVAGKETRQSPIRLKNLLDKLDKQLTSQRVSELDTEILRNLVNAHQFWQHQDAGLAIYLTPNDVLAFSVSRQLSEAVLVDEVPYIKPAAINLTGDTSFAVLTLSWDEACLYRADASQLQLWETHDLPATFDEMVTPRDPEEQIQFTSNSRAGKNASTPMYHGQGEGEEKIEADRRNYLVRVGKCLAGAIYEAKLPVILVATDEVAGHFREVTDSRLADHLQASPSNLTASEILTETRDRMRSRAAQEVEAFSEQLGTLQARGRGSTDVAEIVLAAQQGRVETLAAKVDCEVWGTIDQAHQRVEFSDRSSNTSELVNRALINTLRNSGQILVRDDLAHDIAATLRH